MKRKLLLIMSGWCIATYCQAQSQSAQTVSYSPSDSVLVVVESMPEYPGGLKKLGEFLSENLKYPKQARKAKIQGTVLVGFVVGAEGEIREALISKGLGYGCDEEVIRVVQLMPRWKPGMQDGQPVAVRFFLPVNFRLPQ